MSRPVSILSVVSIFLALIIILGLVFPERFSLFAMLASLFLASIIMAVYLIAAWKRLNRAERWGISLSIIAWLFLLYGFVHWNGLSIRSFFAIFSV